MIWQVLAVCVGAAAGALMRWRLSVLLNPIFPTMPIGTLASNLFGGFVIGLCLEWFSRDASIPLAFKLAAVTGFLGGLTTFSTFSAEAATLLLRREFGWSLALVAAHLIGSILLTLAGIYCVRLLFNLSSRG
jgi:CrcB protein